MFCQAKVASVGMRLCHSEMCHNCCFTAVHAHYAWSRLRTNEMRLSPIFMAALIASQSVSLRTPSEAQKQKLPRMPKAALLLGRTPG